MQMELAIAISLHVAFLLDFSGVKKFVVSGLS